MKMNPEEIHRLVYLCGVLRDEIITKEEFDELNKLLEENDEAQNFYLDYVYLCTDLCKLQAAIHHSPVLEQAPEASRDLENYPELTHPALMLQTLKALGDYEKNAQALDISPSAPEKVTIQKAAVQKPSRKFPTFSLVTFAASLAALLLMILYVQISPPKMIEVATLSDSIDAQWSWGFPLQKGARLATSSESIHLQKGIVKMESDKGVKIIIEAPAKFKFVSPDEILMEKGKLFAYVPQSGNGFSVATENSKVIDLGTSFGVYAGTEGKTELHVFKGKTILIAGPKNQDKTTAEVSVGQALRINSNDNKPSEITLKRDLFIHEIDSETGLVWNGEKKISLADVVGGGSGFGTGKTNTGINPQNGFFRDAEFLTRRHRSTYTPVSESPFVDGVFIPNGYTEQVVTSEKTVFKECPITSSNYYSDIINTPLLIPSSNNDEKYPVLLDDVQYSSASNPCIFLHANLGITFDLDAFRARLPETEILEFCSEIGVSNSARRLTTAGFRVLVDGQLRYHKNVTALGLADIVRIEIRPTDRFLTLITTDGKDIDPESDLNRIGYDWCLFGNPVLILE